MTQHPTTKVPSWRFVLLLAFFWSVHNQGVSLGTHAKAQRFIPDPALKKYILKQMESYKVPGVSLALVDQAGIIWAEGFGMADIARNRKATPRTIFRTASLTKLFTGLGIMQLAEQGTIHLDSPLVKYLPDFQPLSRLGETEPITTRHLLTHHSGVPSDIMYRYFHPDPPPFQSALTYMNQEYLISPPNTILAYSNLGYSLLGVLIERMSGQSYESYIQEHILTPLNMKQSNFTIRQDMAGRYAMGYEDDLEAYEEPPARDIPAMMLHSSVADMAHFIQMILNDGRYEDRQLLTKPSIKAMLTPQNQDIALDFDESIGLSFFLTHDKGQWGFAGGSAEHSGDTFVYHAQLIILPQVGLGVVVLTNGEQGNWVSYSTARSVLQSALFQLRDLSPSTPSTPKAKRTKVSSQRLSPWAGTYFFGAQPVQVIAKRKRLEVHYDGIKLHLIPALGGGYFPRIRKFGIPINDKSQLFHFERIGERQVATLTYANETELLGVKIQPTEVSQAWQDRLGPYRAYRPDSLEMLSSVSLELDHGFLFLNIYLKDGEEGGIQALNPLNDSTAVVYGLGRSTGNTVSIRQIGKQSVLRFEGTEWIRQQAPLIPSRRRSTVTPR